MATYAQSWLPSAPAGSDLANTLDTHIQNFKAAYAERQLTEHYPPSNTQTIGDVQAAGRHRPGIVACTFKGTIAQIKAIVDCGTVPASIDGVTCYGPGEGALVIPTDSGTNSAGVFLAGYVYRFNSSLNIFQITSGLGAYADAVTYPNVVGSQATYLANFSTVLQNTTGRTIRLDIAAIVGDPTSGLGVVTDYAFGFQIYIGQTVGSGLTKWPSAFLIRKLDPTYPDNFFGCCSGVVPPNWYYFIKTYLYIKVGSTWTFTANAANFWTVAISSGRISDLQLHITQL